MGRATTIAAALAIAVAGTGVAVAALADGPKPTLRALPSARADGRVVVAFAEASPTPAARGSLEGHLSAISAVAPDWAALTTDGRFTYFTFEPAVLRLQAQGAALLPVVRDPAGIVGGVLASAPRRNRLALRLTDAVRALGADGLVLDIETVPPAARASYPDFVRTVRRLLGDRATVVTTVPAATSAATAAAGYDLRDLSRSGLVLVKSFGEHDESTGAGPIASLDWWHRVVAFAVGQAPAHRIVLGLPTWGVTWASRGIVRRTEAGVYPHLSDRAQTASDGAELADADGQTWIETDRSAVLKLRTALAAHVAGVALILQGGETTHLWKMPLLAPGAGS